MANTGKFSLYLSCFQLSIIYISNDVNKYRYWLNGMIFALILRCAMDIVFKSIERMFCGHK